MAETTEALTAIQEDIQDQAGMVTRQTLFPYKRKAEEREVLWFFAE